MPLVDPVTMSSSITRASKSAAAAKPADANPPLQPVHVNSTPIAQAVRFASPGLIVTIFTAAFGSLVADPVSAMSKYLPVIGAIQILYACVCLPVAGGQSVKIKKHRPGEKKKAGSDAAGPNIILTALLSFILTTLVTPFLYIAMILFGAPVLTHTPHTLLCAAHLSVLALFPLFYAHGVDSSAWLAVAGLKAPFDETLGGLVGGFLGAWLGAVPIPLDWDREWQKWPVTILCGIYAGYIAGRVIGGTLAFGKRF